MYILFHKMINFVTEWICTYIIIISYFCIGVKYIYLDSSRKKKFLFLEIFLKTLYFMIYWSLKQKLVFQMKNCINLLKKVELKLLRMNFKKFKIGFKMICLKISIDNLFQNCIPLKNRIKNHHRKSGKYIF